MFNKIIAFFKPHKFDLKHPELVKTGVWNRYGEITYPKFTCCKCGVSYGLDLWQMKELPHSMKYGCGGKKNERRGLKF